MRQRGECGRQAGKADDRVEDDVGLGQRGELRQRVRCVDAEVDAIGRDVEGCGLLREQLFVAAGRQCNYAVPVAMTSSA